jgi:hypothetical protein
MPANNTGTERWLPIIEAQMSTIEYIKFEEVDPSQFIPLLNKDKLREHLIGHNLFDLELVNSWMAGKIAIDGSSGCKVRAVLVDSNLAGWCGIQLEVGKYEVALVIDESYWGAGIKIFQEILVWAKSFNHKTVFIHFLYTRPEYKFLRKIAKTVYQSERRGVLGIFPP